MTRLKSLLTKRLYLCLAVLGFALSASLADESCPICGEAFENGQAIIQDFWNNIYHARHQSKFRTCYSCNRLIHPGLTGTSPFEKGGNFLSDGRSVCNICIKSNALVYYPVQAQKLLEEVLESLRKLGVDIPSLYEVELVDEEQMAAFRQRELRPGEKNPALTSLQISRQLLRGNTRIETKCKVYILSGLHELFFRQCLAHELMHVWIFVNCQYEPSPALNEGSCNYLAYQTLHLQKNSDYKTFYLRALERNPDPIYGDGFRRVKEVVTEFGGLKTFLQFLQYNSDFPKPKKER